MNRALSDRAAQAAERRRAGSTSGDRAQRLERLDQFEIMGELENQMEHSIEALGGLVRRLVDLGDLDKAQRVAAAGEKYAARTESKLKMVETQILALFDKVEQTQVNCVQARTMKQQIDETLAQLS